jgi:hypothetical protein
MMSAASLRDDEHINATSFLHDGSPVAADHAVSEIVCRHRRRPQFDDFGNACLSAYVLSTYVSKQDCICPTIGTAWSLEAGS